MRFEGKGVSWFGGRGLSTALLHMRPSTVQARSMSLDRTRDGPFARLAKEADILWKYGGRPDDITVVVAVVSPTAPAMPFRCVAPTATSGTSKGVPPSTGVPEPLAGHTCPEDVLADAIQRWHSSMS